MKTVASNATTTAAPLIITTQSFQTSFVALTPANPGPAVTAFGGTTTPTVPISGTVQCTDNLGNPVLNGSGVPAPGLGGLGNWYIDTSVVPPMLYGPKIATGWTYNTITPPAISPVPLISSVARPGDPQPGPHAILPFCPLPPNGSAVALSGFTTDAASQVSTAHLSFTPQYWGDFYVRMSVGDASSPQQTDQQVVKVHVDPRIPNLVFSPPAQLVYNSPSLDLNLLASSDSPVTITFSTSGPSCTLAGDGHTLNVVQASPYSPPVADCLVTASQVGNETYAPKSMQKAIFIDRASQTIVIDSIPASGGLTYNNNGLPAATLVAYAASTTAPNSNLAVTFTSQTPSVCTVTSGGVLTIMGAGTCTITADQGGDPNYKPAPTATPAGFVINLANQVIAFTKPADATYGNAPFALVATSSSPTAPPLATTFIVFSYVSGPCSVLGASVTITGAGRCTIAADKAGDSNYKTAPTVVQFFDIAKADQIIAFPKPADVTYGDAPFAVTATSSSPTAGVSSSNPIVFNSTTPSTCTTGGTNGSTVTIVTATPPTCTITADQAGDANYNAATQVTRSLAVNKAPTQFTVAASYFTDFGTPTSIDAKLNRTDKPTIFPPNAASVVLKKGGATVNTYSPIAGTSLVPADAAIGGFTITDNLILTETYSLTFDYPGNANFLAATQATAPLRVEGFSAAANMNVARAGHTSTFLLDGTVLVVGGVTDAAGNPTATAEVYCAVQTAPLTLRASTTDVGTFKNVPTPMGTARVRTHRDAARRRNRPRHGWFRRRGVQRDDVRRGLLLGSRRTAVHFGYRRRNIQGCEHDGDAARLPHGDAAFRQQGADRWRLPRQRHSADEDVRGLLFGGRRALCHRRYFHAFGQHDDRT